MTVVTRPDRAMLALRLVHIAVVAAIAFAAAAASGVRQNHFAPPLIDAAVVLGVGAYSLFAGRYWRIRPIAPGAFDDYVTTKAVQSGFAFAAALVGIAVRGLGGSSAALIVGIAISVIIVAFTRPSSADMARHEALWIAVGETRAAELWGTADPDAIPPWEDPDGGHGHELFHTH